VRVSHATIQRSFHVTEEELLLVTIETYLPSPLLVLYIPTKVGIKSYEIQNAALYSLFALL